jgi:hypothetical protein
MSACRSRFSVNSFSVNSIDCSGGRIEAFEFTSLYAARGGSLYAPIRAAIKLQLTILLLECGCPQALEHVWASRMEPRDEACVAGPFLLALGMNLER